MPDVKQTITDFYRVAQDKDFARDFQFRVLNIQGGDGTSAKFTEDDLVYVRTATLPGKTIQNKTVPYMGLTFNVPGSVTYDGSNAWPVEFYCDQASSIRQTFEKYVTDVEKLIKDYTKDLPVPILEEINGTIEDSPVGCGKLWLEDFVDYEKTKKET